MNDLPEFSNFFASLHTNWPARKVAERFAAGWQFIEPDDAPHFEVHTHWAELVIEAESPVLLHGVIADITTNAEVVADLLRKAGITFTAEAYSETLELLRTWSEGR